MATTVKIAKRFTNRSLFNKLQIQHNRTLSSSFYKCQLYSSLLNKLNNNNSYSLLNNNQSSNQLLPSHISHRFMCQTREGDKNEQEEEANNNNDESQEQSESESGEESDNEQTQQITELNAKVDELESELKKYKEALARSHADLINVTNMSKKDVANAKQFATKSFSKDMLSVADALQNCLKVVNENIKEDDNNINEHVKSVIDGVKLTENTLMQTFGRHGIKKIEALNQEFDPNIHEALFKSQSKDVPNDHIMTVISEGYTIKEAILRAAKVGVSINETSEETTDESNDNNEEKKE